MRAVTIHGQQATTVVVDGLVASGPAPTDAKSLAAGTDEVHPGAVNAHTHLYSGLAPLGLPQPATTPRNFVEILEKIWWRLDRALDEAALRASARLYLAQALLAGTTAVIDHHESPRLIEGSLDILADAAQELGIRLATCYGATERNFGRDEGRRGLAECRRFLTSNRRPLVRGMVGLHASFTVGEETLDEAGSLARELSAPVHVHVAEDGADVEDAKGRGHAGVLERLFARRAVPAGSLLAHGVHLTPAAVALVREARLWLVHNPRSNEGNRLPYARVLGAGENVALGTDGWPAQMGVELAALQRLARADDPLAKVSTLARRRLLASRALATSLFELPQAAADLVVAPAGWPETGTPRHVLVAGRVVVEDGVLKTADFEEIQARAREEAPKLWRRMESLS